MKKVFYILILAVLSVFSFTSCEIGLGKSPDIEAPEITVKSMESGGVLVNGSEFAGAIYCKRQASFKGNASDNEKIKSVSVEVKWDGETSYSHLKNADVDGNSWHVNLRFNREGVASLKFLVKDYYGNYSTKSSQVVTLFVDDSAPVGNAWYIDRKVSGIQYSLKDLDYLKNLNLDDAENKDAAQNVAFAIRGSFSDTMGIKDVYIELFDEEGNKLCKIDKTYISGLYAPEFNITASDLSALDNTKLHYVQVKYSAEDVVKVPDSNKAQQVEIANGWFIWWPESDKPRIIPSTAPETDGNIHINIKTTLSLTIFDDDSLEQAAVALLTNSEYSSLPSNWKTNPSAITAATSNADRKGSFTSGGDNSAREVVKSLKAPENPDTTMHLVAYAKDGTDRHEVTTLDIPVQVTDKSTPKLFITSPKTNSIPNLEMQNNNQNAYVTITGETLDTTGCEFLEFVWVPESEAASDAAKNTLATAWLDTVNTESAHQALSGNGSVKVTPKDKMKLWSIPLQAATDKNGFKRSTFTFTVDLFNDFKSGSSENTNEKKKDKYFLVKLTRLDGKSIYAEYKLAKDTTPPEIHAETPSVDMQTIGDEADYTLSFYATKQSGLAIDTSGYKIETITGIAPTNAGLDLAGTKYQATIRKADLEAMAASGTKPKYKFTAKDLFGNTWSEQYTLIISDLPTLTSISSTSSTMLKKGDEVEVLATFSKTVGISTADRPNLKLKLKGIKNKSYVEAYYSGGTGTTTLHFKYTIQEGDETAANGNLTLFDSSPIVTSGISSLAVDKVKIGSFTNKFDSKKIKVDGKSPGIADDGINPSSIGTSSDNVDGSGIAYLREGKTLKVLVTTDEKVTVQGSPAFVFTNGLKLPFAGISSTTTSSTITFSKSIASGDANGSLKYSPSACIENYSAIVDSYGNSLKLGSGSDKTINYYIDTKAPNAPSVTKSDGTALSATAKYKSVTFKVTPASDATIKKSRYSEDGGSTWKDYSAAQTLNKSVQLTAKSIDYAGNESLPSPVINLDISNTFPSYTLECTNPDGYYKPGTVLTFKISFGAKVKKTNNNAKIYITGKNDGDIITAGSYAALKSTNANDDGEITSATFEYTVKATDQFTLKVADGNAANSGVHLDGFKDLYDCEDSTGLTAAYQRNIVCDGVKPYVISMVPGSETENGSNIFTGANVITVTFNEPVQKGEGNIILRQTAGWALPPVISGSDFNTILNAIPANFKVGDLTATQVLYMDEAEDVQDNRSGIKYNNNYYHGTGQYIGPYKKSSYGINADGSPNVATQYVLDINMGIWETTTPHYYGTTYNNGDSATVKTLTAANSTTITANNIRTVLEKVGYHQRVLDVTSASISTTDNRTYTISFPKGLTGGAALPDGREWELVIEKGAFLDYTENKFAEDSSETEIIIPTDNGENTFWSDKVATPVIRIDRYSYGFGIKQSNASGALTTAISADNVTPTGYARVRIDCETKDAVIRYGKSITSNSRNDTAETDNDFNSAAAPKELETSNVHCYSYITKTTAPTTLETMTLGTSYTINTFFAAGNGDYTKSCKDYIVAQGTKTLNGHSFTASSRGKECAFQTVVRFYRPYGDTTNNNVNYSAAQADGRTAFSIRGTTGWGGEPTIVPYPLRDSRPGSCYLRRCYRERAVTGTGYDYYWVSYEILVESSFSGYSWHSYGYYDWCQNWGYMHPGEFTICTHMKNWR